MSDKATVTSAEIARLANVGRAAVSNWRKRHPDFPEPVLEPGGSTTFRRDAVERWLRKQGKLADASPADVVWRILDAKPNVLELVADVAAHPAVTVPAEIRDLLDDLTAAEHRDLVESLCVRAFDRQQRQHLITPPELAHLMVELAAPVAGTVFDPACGPGNLLLAAADAGASPAGQELDPVLARIARSRLCVDTADVTDGDALRADAHPDLRADVVLCDPPFGYRDWGHEELGIDPRWEYGFPVKGEPELAWVQHCLAHTKPGGTAVIALPAGVAGRRSGRVIRQALVRRGALRAVIALPAGVLMSTGIAVHLWVLRNPAGQGAGPLLLVDAGHHEPPRRGQVDWPAVEQEVLTAWRKFQEACTVPESPGRCRAVPAIDLLDEDVDLTPSRHLPPAPVELDLADVARSRDHLTRLLGNLRDLLPEVREVPPVPRATTTINELARVGALTLRQHSGVLDTEENGSGPYVLNGRDVATGQVPVQRCAETSPAGLIPLRPGDVVVPLPAAGDGRPRPLVIEDEDLVLGLNLQLLRVDETRLDPHFLAGHIRGARLGNATGSAVHRIDVRRIEIPVLDLDRQRVLGAAFRRIAAFQAGLRQVSDLGTDMAVTLAEALASGVVEPGS